MDSPKSLKRSSETQYSSAAWELINNAKKLRTNTPPWRVDKYEELVEQNALEVVFIHIVYRETDLQQSKCIFQPKLAHQIFGQKEKMYGYVFPKIHLYFLANSFKCLLEFTHKGMPDHRADIINAKMFDKFISWLPQDYFTDEERFVREIRNECRTTMFGKTIIKSELFKYKDITDPTIIMRECSIDEPGFAEFHDRFQCLIVWYIDAATRVDLTDPNWMFIYVYKETYIQDKRLYEYFPIGFCAVYKFFHYPDKTRVRISQCFVLPCYQKLGVGHNLLTATYQVICTSSNAADTTVEDPCPEFQRLRDTVDATLLQQLECFRYPLINNGFTKRMIEDAKCTYKINKRQCRRIYHILRMGYAIHNGVQGSDIDLLQDIQSYLYSPIRTIARRPLSQDETLQSMLKSSQKLKPTEIEKYINEVRPIAQRISVLLIKEE